MSRSGTAGFTPTPPAGPGRATDARIGRGDRGGQVPPRDLERDRAISNGTRPTSQARPGWPASHKIDRFDPNVTFREAE